jgi:hypothetical protein
VNEVTPLEAFVLDNSDLERLEAIAGEFNPFVAMGWTRQELRHSAFARWLFDPTESHGLGSYPLRMFMKSVVAKGTPQGAPTLFDADNWDLVETRAVVESDRVDLLLRNDDEQFLVVLENKVDTSEHSGQLARYREAVTSQFPDYKHLFVLLSPAGDQPSDEAYVPWSYLEYADLVERLLERRASQIGEDVARFLKHYADMIRRHIVEDSEVQSLCRQIYAKHRQALDLIFEHRPDRAQEVAALIEDALRPRGVIFDQCSKSYIRFATPLLDRVPARGEGWTNTGRMLLFEVQNYADRVILKVLLGPGPKEIRDAVHEHVQDLAMFNRAHTKCSGKWWTFHSVNWMSAKQYVDSSLEEVQAALLERVAHLYDEQMPLIEQALGPLVERLAKYK